VNHKCENCIYWFDLHHPVEPVGECRRYAPKPLFSSIPDGDWTTWWPLTYSSEWCGEFEAKAEWPKEEQPCSLS
jgi:hypothetical protein